MSGEIDRIEAFAGSRFGPGAVVEPLLGDASDRRFFRLRAPSLSPLILMVHAEPFELESFPFFLHGRYLNDIGAAVPQIVASYPSEGILVVQDLGDETLQRHLQGCDPDRKRFLYLQAVRMIAHLQQEGTRGLHSDLPAARQALDADRLLLELRFFHEHYVRGLMRSPLRPDQEDRLDAWFLDLARQVAAYPRVLCHRDFHSRNLMVKGDRLFMVDFQDMRMGPYTYDLASLVRDSYVDVSDALSKELIDFFRETSRAPEPAGAFMAAFARTCLQRNIKAIGTFASQAMLKGNRDYLAYVPRTIAAVQANLRDEGGETGEAIREIFSGPLSRR